MNRDDIVTAYVLDEGLHHVKNSRDATDARSDEVLLGWVTDQPQDALVSHVGTALREDTLVSAAESAEADGEMWLASCRWAAAARAAKFSSGIAAAIPSLHRAADALSRVELGPRASRQARLDKDHQELDVVSDLSLYDPLALDSPLSATRCENT